MTRNPLAAKRKLGGDEARRADARGVGLRASPSFRRRKGERRSSISQVRAAARARRLRGRPRASGAGPKRRRRPAVAPSRRLPRRKKFGGVRASSRVRAGGEPFDVLDRVARVARAAVVVTPAGSLSFNAFFCRKRRAPGCLVVSVGEERETPLYTAMPWIRHATYGPPASRNPSARRSRRRAPRSFLRGRREFERFMPEAEPPSARATSQVRPGPRVPAPRRPQSLSV